MSGKTVWDTRCAALADALLASCAEAMPAAALRIEDRTDSMLAEEDDPRVVPHYPIGVIYEFRVQERRTWHLFGWRRLPIRRWDMLVSFGMEDMWAAPNWAAMRGVWCGVRDARLDEAARSLMERFSKEHGLKLDFSGTRKDP